MFPICASVADDVKGCLGTTRLDWLDDSLGARVAVCMHALIGH